MDLILLAFAVFLRGFEEVTYLYYRCERERELSWSWSGRRRSIFLAGETKNNCYGLLLPEGFGSLLLL